MLFNIFEIIDIVSMTLIIGFLFHDVFRRPQEADDDVVRHYSKKRHLPLGIEWHDFWWASMLIAPTIILHELGDKFAALAFGVSATFHAACSVAYIGGGFFNFLCGLTIVAIVLKIVGFGFLFFVPGYVSVGPGASELQYALISFAGPAVHLLFWLGAAYVLKQKRLVRKMGRKHQLYVLFLRQVNMFLFIFNMIPIPGFDGFNFFSHLFHAFF